MYKTNKVRNKRFILAFSDTRKTYQLMRLFVYIFIIFSIVIVFAYQLTDIQKRKTKNVLFGAWDTVFIDVNNDDVEYFKNHAFIEVYSIQKVIKKISLNDKNRVIIGSCDNSFLKIGNIHLLSGNMPKSKNEVAVEEKYLEILNVSKVGDVISNNSRIKNLQGYKVCGIIDNYSDRWKMANWDIDYVNCFVKENTIDILSNLCFVKLNNNSYRTDITTNFLNFRNNIVISNTIIDKNIIYYWFCILFFCCFFKILLIMKINIKKMNKDSRCIILNKNVIKKFFILALLFNLVYLNTLFFNKLIIKDTVVSDLRISEIKDNAFDNMLVIDDNGYINYFSNNNVTYGNVKAVTFIPDKIIINFLNMLSIFLLLIMSNITLYNYFILIFEEEKKDVRYFLNKYYYNKSIINSITIRRKVYILSIFCIFTYTVLFYIQKNYIEDLKYKIIVYSFGLLNLVFMIIIQYICLRRHNMNKMVDDN